MELTSLERDMLEGKHGDGVALAMKVQVGTGKAFYAKRMVPISRAHVAASAQEGDLYFVTKLVDLGARCLVSLDTLMACGQGYCQGCSVVTRDGYRLCCRDGPVFRFDRVRDMMNVREI